MGELNRLFYGDCLDVLRTLESESIDLVYLEVPRIQLLTVKDLIDGKRPNYLDLGEGRAMNKQAKREFEKINQGNLL